jgi:hypothetical protein
VWITTTPQSEPLRLYRSGVSAGLP